MKTKNILAYIIGCLVISSGVLLIPGLTQAQPNPMPSRDKAQLYLIPVGAITLWAGDTLTIPYGWQLCDGTNDTPDLRDRFIMGGGGGDTGGYDSTYLTTGNLPAHCHSFTTDSSGMHYHTLEDHYRTLTTITYNYILTSEAYCSLPYYNVLSQTYWSGAHDHKGTTDPKGGSMPYDNRPTYYKVAFIIRML